MRYFSVRVQERNSCRYCPLQGFVVYFSFIEFDPDYTMVISNYHVIFSTRECGYDIGLLQGYYITDLAPPMTLGINVEKVRLFQ